MNITGPGVDSPLTQKVTEFGPPLYLENARNGTYTIKMELLDADDKVVAGPMNSTTRTISVDRDAISDVSMGHGGMDMGGSDAGAPAADAGSKKPAKK